MNKQIIFLDFNGALTSFQNELLTVENVSVSDSMLTEADIAFIITNLNNVFTDKQISFTSTKPENGLYSTIFVGKTDAFIQYGAFIGLAETVDTNNQRKDDNAFVNLDNTSSLEEIIETIIHEVAHLIGSLDHGGEGLERYAHLEQLTGTISSAKINTSKDFNCTIDCGSYNTANNVTVTSNLSVSNGGKASNVTICNDAKLTVLNEGYVENVTVIGSGSYWDNAQMLVYKGSTVKDINLAGGELLITDNGCKLTGELVLGGTKGGVNGSLMLSVKDDNIHDYVDPDWSDLNIVFDITSMNPAYLKTSAGGMDVYFSDTRSIETPISYVDPANFIIRVSSGAEGGYYWLTNAEIDMTTYKPITFTKDVIFELDGENIGTFKWNKSKKAYELKTNSGYKASDYKDYKLYSNSMPTSITAHNLPGVVFTCKKPDPVLLYDAEDKILASKKEFSGRFDVTIDGSEINKVVANEKGIVKNVVMNENSQLELNEGAKFLGNNTIAGNVKITGALANTQKDNISLTFDISACKEDESVPILDGYEFITDNVSGLTISVSAEKPESDEAEYILIDNIGSSQGSNLEEITFTVNGKTLKEEYKGQYTFTWDEEYKKYTGINYNGYNYTLSTENNQLTLSVDKNEQTQILYFSVNSSKEQFDSMISTYLNEVLDAEIRNPKCNIVIIADFNYIDTEEGIYYLVGDAAAVADKSKYVSKQTYTYLQQIAQSNQAADYVLFNFSHGNNVGFDSNSIVTWKDVLQSSGCNFSTIVSASCCSQASYEIISVLGQAGVKNLIGSESTTNALLFDIAEYSRRFCIHRCKLWRQFG